MVGVRERTIPTERPPLVGEVSTNFFADRGSHVVSVMDPYGRILDFLDRSRYVFFQVSPQLYSRGWVDPVPDSLLLRKSGSAGNRTRASGSVGRNSDHRPVTKTVNHNQRILEVPLLSLVPGLLMFWLRVFTVFLTPSNQIMAWHIDYGAAASFHILSSSSVFTPLLYSPASDIPLK
jgi:hypothetical protein